MLDEEHWMRNQEQNYSFIVFGERQHFRKEILILQKLFPWAVVRVQTLMKHRQTFRLIRAGKEHGLLIDHFYHQYEE